MFRDILIPAEDTARYGALIPDYYHEGIRQQEYYAVATYAPGLDDELAGVVIMGVNDTWARILWYGVTEEYAGSEAEEEMISSRIRDAEAFGEAEGIIAEFPASFGKDRFMNLFGSLGFETEETESNVAEFSLGSIEKDKLPEADGRNDIIPLKEAEDSVLRELGNLMANDIRNIPVEIPVEWDRYDKDLSLVHMDGDVPAGLILITRSDDHVSVDLAYEKETGNIMALLAALVLNGEKILEPDTRIVIPVVDQRIFGLLKEIAPEAKRGGLLKATLRFDRDMPVTPEEIESLLEE